MAFVIDTVRLALILTNSGILWTGISFIVTSGYWQWGKTLETSKSSFALACIIITGFAGLTALSEVFALHYKNRKMLKICVGLTFLFLIAEATFVVLNETNFSNPLQKNFYEKKEDEINSQFGCNDFDTCKTTIHAQMESYRNGAIFVMSVQLLSFLVAIYLLCTKEPETNGCHQCGRKQNPQTVINAV